MKKKSDDELLDMYIMGEQLSKEEEQRAIILAEEAQKRFYLGCGILTYLGEDLDCTFFIEFKEIGESTFIVTGNCMGFFLSANSFAMGNNRGFNLSIKCEISNNTDMLVKKATKELQEIVDRYGFTLDEMLAPDELAIKDLFIKYLYSEEI